MNLDALFERRALGIRLDLTALQTVYAALGSPCSTRPALHIVGTNGKGSIAAMSDHALRRRGCRTGLFTSPHLQRVTERVRIAGRELSAEELENWVTRVLAHESPDLPRPLSFFEVLTLAALCAFEAAEVDAVVAEAGLGGRWDATRIVRTAAVAVATIGLDHQAWLGPTLVDIAREKVAVFRSNIPVITGTQDDEVNEVIEREAARVGAPLHRVAAWDAPPHGLVGAFQCVNAAVAWRASQILCPALVPADLDGVVWPARLERRSSAAGQFIFDAAHNPQAIRAITAELVHEAPLLVVFGTPGDKDAASMMEILSALGRTWWVALEDPQQPPAESAPDRCYRDPTDEVLYRDLELALRDGTTVLVCGSHRLVGAIRGRFEDGTTRLDPSDPRGAPPTAATSGG